MITMKIYRISFIILFFAIIILPLCFINLKANQISIIDNSKLPEKSTIQDIKSLEGYLSSRLGFREEIINIYTKMNDLIFGKMVHPAYTYGEEKYVFFKTDIEVKDDEYLNTFAQLVKNMQDYVTERNSYFLFVINPTKMDIYSEYLPKGYNFTSYRINYLKKKLDELNVNYIDNTEYIEKISKDEQVFNKKYDAGHWNDIGAFYGIDNIYKRLQSDGIEISSLDIKDYNIAYEKKYTLPVSEFKIDEDVPQYFLKNVNYSIDNKYNNEMEISKRYNYYQKNINKSTENDYKVLFFRGSYMTDKEKFVSNQFRETSFIHNYDNSINFDYYYNIVKPDIVLFETVEYAIKENYYSSKEIKNKKYNENYEKFKNLGENKILESKLNYIRKDINNNHKNNSALTKINLTKENFSHAFLRVDGQIYDFCYDTSQCYLTLDTEILYNKKIDIILISDDLKVKQTIEI